MIIIPDVHGRSFWKEYVKGHEEEDIIFLGDYLDPYGYEGILCKDAIENFKEILKFKKAHMDNVTLLLGNHDFGGYVNDEMPKCRYDYNNAPIIINLFKENIKLFSLIAFRIINDKKVSFSHSYIGSRWLNYLEELKDKSVDEVADILNNAVKHDNQDLLTKCLYIVGRARGGWGLFGSVVWADVCEADYIANSPEGIDYQIFGHSQQEYLPIITDEYACLDVRQGFTLTDSGELINENLNVKKQIV